MRDLIDLSKWALCLCHLIEKILYQLLAFREAEICKEGLVAAAVHFCLIAVVEQMSCGVTIMLQKLRKQARSDSKRIFNLHFNTAWGLYALKSQLVEFTELNPETSVFGMDLTEVKGHCAKLNKPNAYFNFLFALKGRLARCCLMNKIHFPEVKLSLKVKERVFTDGNEKHTGFCKLVCLPAPSAMWLCQTWNAMW